MRIVLFIFFFLSLTISGQNYLPSSGNILSYQKISALGGGFSGSLDYQDYFGSEIENIGDLDGNGVNDIAIGAYLDDDGLYNAGAFWILLLNNLGNVINQYKISSSSGGLTSSLDSEDQFGYSIANIGDLDNDGVNDIAIGANLDDDGAANAGAIYILFMNSNGTVKAQQKISRTVGGLAAALEPDDQFGCSISAIGDLDGDGVMDLAVGALNDDDGGLNRGAIYILFLNQNGTVKSEQKISDLSGGLSIGLDNYDNFGWSVSNIGDHDFDGINDIACSVKGDDDGGTNIGAFYILYLNNSGTIKNSEKISASFGGFSGSLDSYDQFAKDIDTLGDISCDGARDLIVGSNLDDDNTYNSGAAYSINFKLDYLGNHITGVKYQTKISNSFGNLNASLSPNDNFGVSVCFLGDINGDNIGDIAIGANKDDDGQNDAGAIYILFMAPMNLEIELQNSNTSCSPYNDADAQLIVTKGCPPYSITWSTGDTTANIDSLAPGVYHVSISDSTGNLLVDSIIVEAGNIEIVATDSHLCYGDSLDLMAIGSKTDSLVEVLSMHMDALVNINTLPTIAGDLYYLKMKGTWTGAGACESRDPFFYYRYGCQNISPNYATSWKFNNLPPPKPIPYGYNPDHEYFMYFVGSGGSENLYFSDTNYGDNNGTIEVEVYHVYANFLWSNGDTSATTNVKPESDSTYYVTITNGSSVCIDSISVDVTNIVSSVTTTDLICYGDNNGSISILTNGGNPPLTVNWPNNISNSNLTMTNLGFGPYEIIINDDKGCTDTINTLINQPDPYTINQSISQLSCHGDSNGIIQINVSGQSTPYTFNWSNGSGDSINPNLSAGIYTLTLSDSNNCDSTFNFEITQPDLLNVSLIGDTIVCKGDTAFIQATGGQGYIWSNGSNDSSILITVDSLQTISLTTWDQCDTLSFNWTININNLPEGILNNDSSILYGTSLELSSSNGVSYYWTPDSNISCVDCQNPTINPLVPTTYYLYMADNNGCINVDSVFIDIWYENALYIANAFTPNNDGNNDLFLAHVYGYSDFDFKIFNRWGNVVFETDDPNDGWDGLHLGIKQNPGVYVYMIQVTFNDGTEKVFKGDVSLIR